MLLAESLGHKTLAMLVATGGLVWFLEATIFDSQHTVRGGASREAISQPVAAQVTFTATAYCTGTVTSAGVTPQRGVAAADRAVLPPGSIIDIDTGDAMLGGLYTVLDTGPNMKGRRVDLYTKSCADAVRFGRRTVQVSVLRLGWSPEHSTLGRRPEVLSKTPGASPPRWSGSSPSRSGPAVTVPAP